MKDRNDKPLQEKCAWCGKKLKNHHRLCDKCHSVKQKRIDIGKRRKKIPNESKSKEHNEREIKRWNNNDM